MKAAQFIIQYLLFNKKVTLQQLGTFYMSGDWVLQEGTPLPEGAIHFSHDSRAKEDEGLIKFIMEQTRKIRPLASSDLESYLNLGYQFLNLGKPFSIEGLGTLQKDAAGVMQFFQGTSLPNAKAELKPGPDLREKANEDISFAAPAPSRNKWKLWAIFLVIFTGLTATTVYYFLSNPGEKEVKVAIPAPPKSAAVNKPVTSVPAPAPAVPAENVNDSTAPAPVATTEVKQGFRVVLKEFPYGYNKAFEYYSKYKSTHNLKLYTDDTTLYKVAILINRPLSDTARVKDSLTRLLHGMKIKIDLSEN